MAGQHHELSRVAPNVFVVGKIDRDAKRAVLVGALAKKLVGRDPARDILDSLVDLPKKSLVLRQPSLALVHDMQA